MRDDIPACPCSHDVPVFPVGGVPELDRVVGLEIRRVPRVGMEQPFAHDPRPVRSRRPQPVRHHVVGVEAQQEVREDRIVVDALEVLFGKLADRLRARPPAHRHAAALLGEHHVSPEERALDEIVVARAVGGELRQARMDHRAMEAFRVVLEQELPVGLDVVLDPPPRAERVEPEAREPVEERGVRVLEGLGLLSEMDEQEAAPRGGRRPVQRIVRAVEPFDLVHVGRAQQTSVERVGPRVVRALDRAAQPPPLLFAESRPAMAAHVVMGARDSILPADDDHALARGRDQEVLARLRDLLLASGAEPGAQEDPLLLLREDLRRRVIEAGERPRAGTVALLRFEKPRRRAGRCLFAGVAVLGRHLCSSRSVRTALAARRPEAPVIAPAG